MGKVEIISASAGSGKTTRLTEVLVEALEAGGARPEGILATTFTTKAAAELEERVRRALLGKGRVEQAARLAGARLGTVNGVCGQLVSDFAFELGLSPRLEILDEELAGRTLKRCLAEVLEGPRSAELEDLWDRLPEYDWRDAVHRVVDAARANGLSAEDLPASAARSTGGFLRLFGPPLADDRAAALDAELEGAMEALLVAIDPEVDTTKATAKGLQRVRDGLQVLRAGRRLPWSEWLALAGLEFAKKSLPLAQPLRAAAAQHDVHPLLHADLRRAISLVFGIAAEALRAYEAEKRTWGAIDFVDQEVLALRLLSLPEVQAELGATLELVLVDEFQDTSPLQLAIFLKLAELAPRSVWVGDQKQAIYGFRGADPLLMDAAVEQLLGGAEPETLRHSWRSRGPLVALTSGLFAPPFDAGGIPEARVRLTVPARGEPSGLGAVLEHWQLGTGNAAADAHALAAGVRELLGDPEARVRGTQDEGVREIRAGDVAVLCRTHDSCLRVAQALEAQGLRVALPRPGLLKTTEGQVALAALRLFVDGRDALAAAELARALRHPEDPDGFLARVLEAPRAGGFAGEDFALALAAARERLPVAGALAALDAALDAVGMAERCREWGDSAQRLGNLDRLRAHALAYVEGAGAEGRGATPVGLVTHLASLAADGLDLRSAHEGVDAVKVSTWHAAKGLEWPVVVLFDLDSDARGNPRGVRAVGEATKVDLSAPLAGRWVRFWPEPYTPAQKKAPFHERLAESEEARATLAAERAEGLRMLYVGWTRARDRVVLAGRGASLGFARLGLLGAELPAVEDGIVAWAGVRAPATVRVLGPLAPQPAPREEGRGPPLREVRDFAPAFRQPSSLEGTGTAGIPESLGATVALAGRWDAEQLGQAVHGFLGADLPGLAGPVRLALAAGHLARWGVAGALPAEDVVEMGARLRAWVERTWPGARWRREWPVAQVLPDGALLRGIADLVLEVEGGLVLVDHKSHPGGEDRARAHAEGHAGQLAAYAGALEAATGLRVLACYIHLPVGGFIVPVELPAARARAAS